MSHRHVATEKGGPEVLEWQEFKPGPPQRGEVAVKVEAAGVLLADVLWQLGIAPVGPKPPFTPGYDVVGVIEEVGPGVSGLERGQRVAALIQYGGYTEYAILPTEKVVLVPEGVDPKSAAGGTFDGVAHPVTRTDTNDSISMNFICFLTSLRLIKVPSSELAVWFVVFNNVLSLFESIIYRITVIFSKKQPQSPCQENNPL